MHTQMTIMAAHLNSDTPYASDVWTKRAGKMNKHKAWSEGEDAQLIHLCENKMIGLRRYEAFNCQYPDRTTESVRQRIVTLRRKHKVR